MAFGFATYSWFLHPFRWWRFTQISLNVRQCIPSLTSDWNWLYIPGPIFPYPIGKATRLSIGARVVFDVSQYLKHCSTIQSLILIWTLCNSSFLGTHAYTDYDFSISLWIIFDCSSLLINANTWHSLRELLITAPLQSMTFKPKSTVQFLHSRFWFRLQWRWVPRVLKWIESKWFVLQIDCNLRSCWI